ncbi:uncharacterized protein RJT20DRAFT_36609 [Scheffersomyces xylosifermentans]|uniref:uncharacterized protein n=1 Tax=Scheffersomyces xylosifermentans TaxID=1304137 RepID=UPI00315DCC6C
MSITVSDNSSQHTLLSQSSSSHPDWVSMDIHKLGRSFYTDEQPLNEHIRTLKAKVLREELIKRSADSELNESISHESEDADSNSIHKSSYNDHGELFVEYSRSNDGLISNDLRAKIWPILLGIDLDDKDETDTVPKHNNDNTNDNNKTKNTFTNGDANTGNNNTNNDLTSSNATSQTLNENDDLIDFVDHPDLSSDPLIPDSPSEKVYTPKGMSTNKTSKLNAAAASFLLSNLDSIDLPPHKDEDQVRLDIQRSFTILNHIQSIQHASQADSFTTIFSNSDIEELKKRLFNLIIKVLRKYPSLNYYQGYHDIASIVLLVCNEPQPSNKILEEVTSDGQLSYCINEEAAYKILERLTVFHLRDFMTIDINLSVNHLRLIPALLEAAEPTLFELIKQTSNSYIQSDGTFYDYAFYQALSALLTLYSHDISSITHILTLWDFGLSYNSILINVYIYVGALQHFKHELLMRLNVLEEDGTDFRDVDSDLVHTLLSPANLFSGMTDNDLVRILNNTKKLVEKYSFHNLCNSDTTFNVWFKEFNKSSVLLTTSSFDFDKVYKHNHYKHLLVNSTSPDSHTTALADLVQEQDLEMSRQTIHDLAILQKMNERQEAMANSITSETDFDSSPHSLSSSLSLGSSSSSVNSSIVNTSSMILKKLFRNRSHDTSEPSSNGEKDKKVIKRNQNLLFDNIYKISFTIGFVGFLMHFLVARHHENFYSNNFFRYFNFSSPIKRFGRGLINNEPINALTSEISTISTELINDMGEVIGGVCNFVKESEIVNSGITLGQVGLGSLRNTLYGFIS